MPSKQKTKKELEHQIELLDEIITDGDMAEIELSELQKEYKKRFGFEYEY